MDRHLEVRACSYTEIHETLDVCPGVTMSGDLTRGPMPGFQAQLTMGYHYSEHFNPYELQTEVRLGGMYWGVGVPLRNLL